MKYERTRIHRAAGLFCIPERRRWKSSANPPPAANPTTAIDAQTQSNIATADANRTNQVTPYGASNWSQDPSGRWTQTQSFNPQVGSMYGGMLDAAGKLNPAAGDLATQGRSSVTAPLDFTGANQDYLKAGPQLLDQKAVDAVYGQQKSFLDPQWGQQQRDMEDQLSRQGIPVGSDAYNRASTNFNNSRTQAYQSAQDSAIGTGAQNANSLFNMALMGQQQNVGQQQLAQQNPLKLLSLLYGGGSA